MDLKTFMQEHKYQSRLSYDESILYYKLLAEDAQKEGREDMARIYNDMSEHMKEVVKEGVEESRNSQQTITK